MCATYGLGGGPYPTDDDGDVIDPMNDPGSAALLSEWMEERGGTAKITGKNARNLNPIIRSDATGERSLKLAWWWLWLSNDGPFRYSAFNSRDDKLLGRSWKRPFQNRALLPATWYVEKGSNFHLPGNEVFGIAALTSTVTPEEDGELVTYSMVTREAVGEAAGTWNRMPLILPRDLHDEWLDPERPGDAELVARVQHASEEISRAMTTGTGDDATLF